MDTLPKDLNLFGQQCQLENLEPRANQLYYWLKACRGDPLVCPREYASVADQYRVVVNMIATEVAQQTVAFGQ